MMSFSYTEIIKTEVIYREKRFKDYQEAIERIAAFIDFYNNKRPHGSIGMKVPAKAHTETGAQTAKWRERKKAKNLKKAKQENP